MMNNDDRRIRDAIDSIEPSDGAEARMLANIRKKAEAQAVSSDQKRSRGTARKPVWIKWAAMAACFVLIVTAVVIRNDRPAVPTAPVYHDGVIGERPAVNAPHYESEDAEPMPSPSEPEAPEPSLAPRYEYSLDGMDPVIGEAIVGPTDPDGEYSAGMLTAGEWKDTEAMADWVQKLSENEDWAAFVKERGLNTANFVKVTVTDGEKKCFNAKVELTNGDSTLFTARTDVHGCAYLFYSINREDAGPIQVKVGDTAVSVDGNADLTIDAADAGVDVTALDLMLMVDTTGSMADELEYLKAELSDMVQRISKETDSLSIRVSVNFYRDEGDEYVVRYFDFREDITECLEQIRQQSADGGDDFPEAVHTALENAVSGHAWREDAVKLCFLVLDAPPHSEQQVQGVNASLRNSILQAAQQGIRIIPVASSGVDSETEFLLRSYALLTGGTYVFLTDDSGIGNGHKDPDIDESVTVELLNDCMVRIACEYCGMYSGEKVTYTPPEPPYHQ